MSYKNKDGKSTSAEENPPLPCRSCGDLTPRATLSSYGGWCGPCFGSYCRDTPVQRPYVETQTVKDMKSQLRVGHRFASLDERLAA